MKNPWDICVVHHSHTDIGYTDLQEKIIHTQVDFIRCAVSIILGGYERDTPERDFKWNCETYFCVERFLAESTEDERNNFFACVKRGNIGISASYLNFSDLVDIDILNRRTREMVEIFARRDIQVHSAMNADVNGISLGMWDVFAEQGIDFFFTNIHCHHGMYPLYRNQTPYYWKHGTHGGGKRILVWNGEHYHLGNVFGLVEEAHTNFITENYVGTAGGTARGAGADSVSDRKDAHIASIKAKFDAYIGQLLDSDYPYRFFPIGVSGVFSDNGPPNPDIIHTIGAFNERFGEEMRLRMVTLDELGEVVKQNVENGASDVPEYRGDVTDWWAHGVASTPYAVKHYREARRIYHLCRALDPEDEFTDTDTRREAEDNLLLFAEHTWGHSSTIGDPYSTIVNSLDIRNISYASKAHEASNVNFLKIAHNRGDIMRYYSRSGRIKAIHTGSETARRIVSFYIEAYGYQGIRLICEKTQEEIPTQSSDHPRGILINFIDTFAPNEEKPYRFQEVPRRPKVQNTRVAYIGSERVQDIVNDYDPLPCRLPHTLENDFFRIDYRIPEGVISFYDKRADQEMLCGGDNRFFTPIYERTEIRTDPYEERRLLGRNIRGLHAQKTPRPAGGCNGPGTGEPLYLGGTPLPPAGHNPQCRENTPLPRHAADRFHLQGRQNDQRRTRKPVSAPLPEHPRGRAVFRQGGRALQAGHRSDSRQLHGVLSGGYRRGVRGSRLLDADTAAGCADGVHGAAAAPSDPALRQRPGEQPAGYPFLGDEQYLGNQFQDGPLGLRRVLVYPGSAWRKRQSKRVSRR